MIFTYVVFTKEIDTTAARQAETQLTSVTKKGKYKKKRELKNRSLKIFKNITIIHFE